MTAWKDNRKLCTATYEKFQNSLFIPENGSYTDCELLEENNEQLEIVQVICEHTRE